MLAAGYGIYVRPFFSFFRSVTEYAQLYTEVYFPNGVLRLNTKWRILISLDTFYDLLTKWKLQDNWPSFVFPCITSTVAICDAIKQNESELANIDLRI